MIAIVDVKKEAGYYRSLKTKWLFAFFISTLCFFAIMAFSIAFSPDNYLALEIVLMILSTLFIWGVLYFFGAIYKRISHYCRFFQSALAGLREKENLIFDSFLDDETITKAGMKVKIMKTHFLENGKTFERDLYVFDALEDLKSGSAIEVETFSNVVLSYEVTK